MPTNQELNSTAPRQDSLWTHIWRYIVFGAFSTAVDFAMLNLLEYILNVPGLIANTISLTVGLAVSYGISERLVFRNNGAQPWRHSRRRQIVYFVLITLVGVYGLQSGLFALLGEYPLAQQTIANFIAPILGHVKFNILEANVMKLLATIATAVWNFVLSRQLVFAYAKSQADK